MNDRPADATARPDTTASRSPTASLLPWLPMPGPDFSDRLQAGPRDGQAAGMWARIVSTHDLDFVELRRLAKRVRRLRSAEGRVNGLDPAVLAIVGNGTTGFLEDAIAGSAPRHALDVAVHTFAFNQIAQQVLNPASELYHSGAEYLLLAIDHRGLPFAPDAGDASGAAARSLKEAAAYLRELRDAARKKGIACIFQTVAQPPLRVFGSFDVRLRGTLRWLIDSFNRMLIEEIAGPEDYVFDVAGLAAAIGDATWYDPVSWHLAKAPLSLHCVPAYADALCSLLAAVRGKPRKCLVLDLDNTVWGGEIGDAGIAGIALGQGSPAGEAYVDIQRYAAELRRRGVLLAVCSRNDPDVARAAFREHSEMQLKESDIAAFEIGWGDKASGLRAIAKRLNILPDSLVFLDDNPRERLQVRQEAPEIAVPEFPADPARVPMLLSRAGYFEAVAHSSEDRERADYYRREAARTELREQSGGDERYLGDLQMRLTLGAVDERTRTRVTQLINKTNQFNLTTRRTTQAEVEGWERDPAWFTLWARLEDRFGDNGIIAAITCARAAEAWTIDTFVMSCRVLGRHVEAALIRELAARAAEAGASTVRGRYIPTDRNGIVADLYERLGFRKVTANDPAGTEWELDVASVSADPLPLSVVRAS